MFGKSEAMFFNSAYNFGGYSHVGSSDFLVREKTIEKAKIYPLTFSVLIDASRDYCLWWFPQAGTFDPDKPHQGQNLTDYLGTLGGQVSELSHNSTPVISRTLLCQHDLVIRIKPSITYSYTNDEVEAYKTYVRDGGKLILLGHFMLAEQKDSLAEAFGVTFEGIVRNERCMSKFIQHPLTEGLSQIPYSGCGVTNFPAAATIVAWLSDNTLLEINNNQFEEAGEYHGVPAMGCMQYGQGKMVFIGDTYLLSSAFQPLTTNIINWLLK